MMLFQKKGRANAGCWLHNTAGDRFALPGWTQTEGFTIKQQT